MSIPHVVQVHNGSFYSPTLFDYIYSLSPSPFLLFPHITFFLLFPILLLFKYLLLLYCSDVQSNSRFGHGVSQIPPARSGISIPTYTLHFHFLPFSSLSFHLFLPHSLRSSPSRVLPFLSFCLFLSLFISSSLSPFSDSSSLFSFTYLSLFTHSLFTPLRFGSDGRTVVRFWN